MNYFNDRNTLNAAIALGAKEARCCLCGKKHEINKSPCSSKLRKLYTAMNDVLYTYTELFSRMTKTIMRNNNAAKKAEKIMSTNGIKYNLAFTPPIENQKNCRHLEFLQPESVCKHIISKLDETYEIIEPPPTEVGGFCRSDRQAAPFNKGHLQESLPCNVTAWSDDWRAY
jgi:hypothetical protein